MARAARAPLRSVNGTVLALLLLLAGVGPGFEGPGGASGQLSARPTRGPHPSSPCPSVFSYEGREPEKNRWYGVILVATDEALDGLVLNVRLTHRAQILGNFIGEVTTSDNVEFSILNLKQRLSPGPPLPVRIFAAFGDRDDIPYIATIKLNGRTICGSNSIPSLDTGLRPLATPAMPSRISKPAVSRPAGVGGAGGGAAVGEEEPRPRPQPTPPATRPTPPPAPRTTTSLTPAKATPPSEPAPNANPDNYYPPNDSEANRGGETSPFGRNQYDGSARQPVEEAAYRQPAANHSAAVERGPGQRPVAPQRADDVYGSVTEAERGIYRPPSSTPSTTTTGRAPPKYTANEYQSTTASPRQPPPKQQPRPSADRRPSADAADVSSPPPQPWPTSNYGGPAGSEGMASAPRPGGPGGPGPGGPGGPGGAGGRPRPARSTCGTTSPPATPLIINGETSIPGKWPWHVALYKPHGRDWKYQCGGSLISPTVVVTAAHCVTTTVGRPVDPESLLVFLGKHALRTTSEDGVQDKHVYYIHTHPQYNYTNYRNDIAVLILSSPANITPAVRPVCLWDKDKAALSHVEGKFGTVVGWRTDLAQPETDSDKVVGWGIETDGLLTEELHQALMPVVSPAICVYSYPAFFGVYTNNQTYCAGYSPDQPAAGTSVCNGDSGGGMYFKQSEDAPDDEAVWMLRGLVSLSVRTKQDRCDPSHFVVFTDVAKYVDWLETFLVAP